MIFSNTKTYKNYAEIAPASICKAAPVMKLIVSDIVPGVRFAHVKNVACGVCLTRIIGHHLVTSLGSWLYLMDIASLELG